ncbi:MAG TPA: hypothetical protein VGO18_18045 [Steroidobacteraceae bacterium]|jgi:hypothetical protein|nr:hypothetical protein [Steroidobacteraceae bacterium]
MSLVADFLTNGVAPFMNAHTLSLPGALIDGGTIDYTDPAYAPALGRSRKIVVPTGTVAASWVPGRRPRDAQLLLKVSRAYKMASTGRTEPVAGGGGVAPLKGEYERERTALKQQAISGGLARKAYRPTEPTCPSTSWRSLEQQYSSQLWSDLFSTCPFFLIRGRW